MYCMAIIENPSFKSSGDMLIWHTHGTATYTLDSMHNTANSKETTKILCALRMTRASSRNIGKLYTEH